LPITGYRICGCSSTLRYVMMTLLLTSLTSFRIINIAIFSFFKLILQFTRLFKRTSADRMPTEIQKSTNDTKQYRFVSSIHDSRNYNNVTETL